LDWEAPFSLSSFNTDSTEREIILELVCDELKNNMQNICSVSQCPDQHMNHIHQEDKAGMVITALCQLEGWDGNDHDLIQGSVLIFIWKNTINLYHDIYS
jgi:hypothetical protein